MSVTTQTTRKTTLDIIKAKGKQKLVCLTAYSTPMAEILDPHCDLLLVGDSVGMVLHGMKDTTTVTLDMMVLHGQAVMRGSEKALVVVDLPFGSYEQSPEIAYQAALRLIREVGCQAVKLEVTRHAAKTIAFLVERGIPVAAHIGLLPQSVNVSGGFRIAGKTPEDRQKLIDDAIAVADAGAFCVVIEGIVNDLAKEITDAVAIPTIGIGASVECDGQILVTDDMLGQLAWSAKFVRRYAELRETSAKAVARYAADVRSGSFPDKSEVYYSKK
ncbi:MAG: 3-methyl-2-oxobutanoate hydroxymethyltransferase [Rhodospirillales bacterium]|nr:3-methyl-2-oxobutanoate hydroxymethyltransferase [Rhodospirillales bacterium]